MAWQHPAALFLLEIREQRCQLVHCVFIPFLLGLTEVVGLLKLLFGSFDFVDKLLDRVQNVTNQRCILLQCLRAQLYK